jgi:small subunit ribosomal protein S9
MPKPIAYGTGRRKTSVARVFLYPGDGKITVNKRPFETYFQTISQKNAIVQPLQIVGQQNIDVVATLKGGGISGQADALKLGLARALCELEPEKRVELKKAGLLTRDAREKEPKKYGLKKARKAPQYTKR